MVWGGDGQVYILMGRKGIVGGLIDLKMGW